MLKLYLCSREQKINKQINNLFLGTRKRYTGRDEIYQVVTFDFPLHDCKDSRYGKKKSDEKQKLQKKQVLQRVRWKCLMQVRKFGACHGALKSLS